MITLGLDIGTNSVGSAWVDTEGGTIDMGVSVFPAGVEEQINKRGAPLNQKRREKRQLRRVLARRAERKRLLRKLLVQVGLLPRSPMELEAMLAENPWLLRRKALAEPLTPHQFGRVLLHLNQRRGASNIVLDAENPEEGKVKEAMDRLKKHLDGRTFGQFIADLMEERRVELPNKPGVFIQEPVRNRQYHTAPEQHFYADRHTIHDEFVRIWEAQRSFGGSLATMLTDDLLRQLDDPSGDDVWQHRGILFGQRRQCWDVSTLGRCTLEPTDQCCPHADMYAQEFRVVESVNNIRIEERGNEPRPLTEEQRQKVMAALRSQKTASTKTVRRALGLDKKKIKAFYALNIERDPDRKPNTDWFYREIVIGVWGEASWEGLTPEEKRSVNRAVLKFDPDNDAHEQKLQRGCSDWWNLPDDAAGRFIAAWKKRPRLQPIIF